MIETYNVNELSSNISDLLIPIMKICFLITIVLITIMILISLLVWLFGAKKKSEKAINFGIRNFVISFVTGIIAIIILIVFALSK